MRKLKAAIFGVAVLALATVSLSAQTNAPLPEPPIPTEATNVLNNFAPLHSLFAILPSWDKDADAFHADEFVVGASPLWKTFAAAGSTPFASVHADYFLTDNIGLGGEVITFGDGTGSSDLDTLLINATFRKPVGNIAAYAMIGGGYDLNREKALLAIGGGFEYRYRNGLGLFFDTRYSIEGTEHEENGLMHRFGLRWKF